MTIKKGDLVRLIQPVVQGEVIKVQFDPDTGEKRLLLRWDVTDESASERWFAEDELEIVPV
jgi:hypothetical protein